MVGTMENPNLTWMIFRGTPMTQETSISEDACRIPREELKIGTDWGL